MSKIEEFLGLDEDEIKRRSLELIRTIRTIPGIGYLETIAKRFEVQPWPFITYLAYNNPELLEETLGRYRCYDGSGNYEAIKEGIREYYILGHVLYSLVKAKKDEERTVDSQ